MILFNTKKRRPFVMSHRALNGKDRLAWTKVFPVVFSAFFFVKNLKPSSAQLTFYCSIHESSILSAAAGTWKNNQIL
jgi:hypothetical protein